MGGSTVCTCMVVARVVVDSKYSESLSVTGFSNYNTVNCNQQAKMHDM